MRITKIGHCCLVLEHEGKKILTDPGTFTTEQMEALRGLDAILITHEHQDHFHIPSVAVLLRNNPDAKVACNGSVAKLLAAEKIPCVIVGDGQSTEIGGIAIEGFGKDHAPIYQTMGLVENTGYFVADKFYFPGDAFHDPGKAVDVLALPTAGPWVKLSEAIDFAKRVKPRVAFAVHDGMIIPMFAGFVGQMIGKLLGPDGTEFVTLGAGEGKEF